MTINVAGPDLWRDEVVVSWRDLVRALDLQGEVIRVWDEEGGEWLHVLLAGETPTAQRVARGGRPDQRFWQPPKELVVFPGYTEPTECLLLDGGRRGGPEGSAAYSGPGGTPHHQAAGGADQQDGEDEGEQQGDWPSTASLCSSTWQDYRKAGW